MNSSLLFAIVTFVLLLPMLVGCSVVGKHVIERDYPPIGQFIEVNGQRLHFTDHGRGVPIVLVHGANSNLRDFESSIAPLLAQKFRVISFDRPGFGYSERAESAWQNPGDIADLLLTASEMLGAPSPVILGHSWAGSVVMAAGVHEAHRIRAGVLISGATGHWAGPLDPIYEWCRNPIVRKLMAWTVVYPFGQLKLPSAVAAVAVPEQLPDNYIENIGAPLALRSQTFQDNIEDMNQLSEYLQTLSRDYACIDAPLMAIHGEADDLVPFWNHTQRLIPVIPQLQVHLIPGAGHIPHHTNSIAVARWIEDFVRGLNVTESNDASPASNKSTLADAPLSTFSCQCPKSGS